MTQEKSRMFSITESCAGGLKVMFAHARLFAMLSFVPLAVAFATMMVLRALDGQIDIFWLPLMQLPSSFVQGLQCALILRFLLLQEYPIINDDAQRRARNIDVMQGAAVYMIFNYLLTGVITAMTRASAKIEVDPIGMAPYTPLLMIALVLMFYALRWYWLFVPVSLGWDPRGFYERLRGWGGSLRIGGLFLLCSLLINTTAFFLRYALMSVSGSKNAGDFAGVWAVLDDGLISLASVVMGVLFSCASAYAVKSMLTPKKGIVV